MLKINLNKHLSLKSELRLYKVEKTLHAYDGIQFDNNVDGFTERRLRAKVVDNILNAPVYYSRLLSKGVPFVGKTEDVTVDVVSDTQGQFFTGLETLSASPVTTTITLSYAQTAFTQPQVSVMVDSFANAGQKGTIPLDAFKYQKAASQAVQALGSAIYGTGTANQPDGLGIIVLDSGTIGGQARATYSALNATVTASSGTLTLAKMATLFSTVSAPGLMSEEPNVGLSNSTVWDLYEQLLAPNVRAGYDEVGYDKVPVRSMTATRGNAQLQNGQGFTSLSYRGIPILKDNFATSQTLFFLNENYYEWHGRTEVPSEYKSTVEKVNLGTSSAYEGTGAEALDMPSEYNGFFYQKPLTIPYQAGMLARFYVIGQVVAYGFRRQGKLTGITSV